MNLENVLTLLGSQETQQILGRKPQVLNVYAYGSRVFGNVGPNADYDYIVVETGEDGKEANLIFPGIDITVYDCKRFRDRVLEHEISVLECLHLPPHHVLLQKVVFGWSLNKSKLREAFSAKSSNSWVKAKKKFDVEKEPYIAKKSLWHSLRILKFGLQIANHGKIVDFTECNDLWKEIHSNPSVVWEDYKKLYQETYNSLKTQFRLAAPKETS